jgi:hypothetical protein
MFTDFCSIYLQHEKNLICFLVATTFGVRLPAQSSFGKVIVGIESAFDVAQFSEGIKAKASPYFQAEIPFWKFSVGAGFGKQFYPDYEFYTSNGAMTEREVNGATVRYYLADLHSFQAIRNLNVLHKTLRIARLVDLWSR